MTITVKLFTGIVTVLLAVVAFLGAFNTHVAVNPVEQAFGAVTGPDVFIPLAFHAGFTNGGKINASSTVTTETLAVSDIVGVAEFNGVAASAATVTLPTRAKLSAAGFLPNAGDSATIFVHASTSIITLAGNTGVALRAATTTAIGIGATDRLEFVRLPANEGGTYEVLQFGN